MKNKSTWNTITQIFLIAFTILGYLATSLKYPQYGLIIASISQIFWLYSSYKAWKEADQFGIFVTTVIITVVVIWGVINYWFL